MAYQSLYRRYRPRRFAEVRGQEHLVRALQNAVREERVGHAYLFSGPRGTGKTSTARILAKVLNCEAPVDGEPCGECASCLAIDGGTSFDVHELDAASNNGVEAVRDLIAKASLGTPGRTKVYILDEVHMLSTAASNALLKTLEEPPDHVVFVLATTDPQKVLPTIRSRTQHFEVHLLPAADLEALVDFVVDDAGLEVSPEARDYVLRVGAGSARDTLSALDQVVAAGGVLEDTSVLDELVEALCDRDTGRALLGVERAVAGGRSPRLLGEQLISRLRDVFLAALGTELVRLADRERALVEDQARRLGAAGSTRALEVLGDAFVGIQDAPDQRIPLEVALVRLTRPDTDTSPAALADRLARLEQAVQAGGPLPAPAAVTSAAPVPAEAPVAASTPEEAEAAPAAEGRRAGPPPPRPAGGRPADAARTVLAGKRSGPARPAKRAAAPAADAEAPAAATPSPPPPARPEPGAARRSAPAPADDERPPIDESDAPADEEPRRRPATAAASGREPVGGGEATVTPPSPAAGGLPSRDELTLAWGDTVLGGLPQKARVRLAGGRWVDVDGAAAVFGLPNQHHLRRCEEVRAEAEAALQAHFGRPVPIRLVIDDEASPPAATSATGSPLPPDQADEEPLDPAELVDAGDVAGRGIDRITELFPGAELVDEP